MDFSGLEGGDGMSGKAPLFYLSDSDEFPDLHELVRTRVSGAEGAQGSLPSCNSDYSDSDMDAMVRDARITPTETDAVRTQNDSASSKRKRSSIEAAEDLTITQVTAASSSQIQRPHFLPQVRAQS